MMISFRSLINKQLSSKFFSSFRFSQQIATINEDESHYPLIIDASKSGRQRHARQMWYDSIKALPTVEEKLYELALQKRLKLKIFMLSSVPDALNVAPFQNYITRTHLIHGLPEKILRLNVDKELDEIRDIFCKVLYNEFFSISKSTNILKVHSSSVDEDVGIKLLKALIAQSYKKLAVKNDYILESTIHSKPRISSFWWHDGFESKSKKLYEENLCFQFEDFPSFVIRMKKPLSPIFDMNDPLCSTADVPDYNYHPKTVGIPFKRRCISSVPGYWPGDPYEYPLLLAYSRSCLNDFFDKVQKYDVNTIDNGFGIMSSFGWLNAVATYQGFTPFHDLTYPLVAQTILTNGQDWNFFVYQLNTIAFHSDVDNKDRRNICWSSGKLRLFDSFEDGQIKGINDEVFEILLKFLLNAPQVNENILYKPYLGEDVREEEEAKFMRFFLRRMYSLCPDPLSHKEEIPTWRRIYKMHPDAPPSPFVKND